MSRNSKCPSAWVTSTQVSKCPSNVFRVPKVLRFPSALSTRVPLGCPWTAQFPFECSSSKKSLQHYKEPVNNFIEFFKNLSEYIFYITLIVFSFLVNKMCTFNHVLLAICNHLKKFQKLPLNYLQSFRKLTMMESRGLFIVKLL